MLTISRLKPNRFIRSRTTMDPAEAHLRGSGAVDVDAIETRWLEAAAQLRDMAEFEAERRKALERFVSDANEESWRDWHRLLLSRAAPGA